MNAKGSTPPLHKDSELKAASTRCDFCSNPASVVAGEHAYCSRCARDKRASGPPLKSASVYLSERFRK